MTAEEALQKAIDLHMDIDPASNTERYHGSPGADAMGAILEYRDAIKDLLASIQSAREKGDV